jgi:hypothetical protein
MNRVILNTFSTLSIIKWKKFLKILHTRISSQKKQEFVVFLTGWTSNYFETAFNDI